MNSETGRHLVIEGIVQGVGFRYAFQAQAMRLGLSGWVRNRRDGSVEAVVSGTPEAVEAMIAWSRAGPPSARVTRVAVTPADATFTTFELRPSA